MQIKTKFKRNNLVEIIGEKLNTKELTDIISSEIDKEVKLRFYTEKDPKGNKWQPNGRGGKILRDTGQLMNSIHRISDGKVGGVATNKIYARIHNEGGIIRPKEKSKLKIKGVDGKFVFVDEVEIPKRQFFGMNKKLKDRIKKKISKKILENIKNS